MQYIDLTHLLHPGISVYPGAPQPAFLRDNTHESSGYAEIKLHLSSHHGTHLDAPFHILPDGKKLDELPPEQFIGKGMVVDCSHLAEPSISLEYLLPYREKIASADFVLLRTDWSKRWSTPAYLEPFPTLTPEAARWLCTQGLKGIGLDVISIDPIGATAFTIHEIVLGAGLIIIENLTNLDQLGSGLFQFFCLPLPIERGDGSPIRAVAILQEN